MAKIYYKMPVNSPGYQKHKRVLKREWLLLSPSERSMDKPHHWNGWRTIYYAIINVQPKPNPAIPIVEKKLKRAKIAFLKTEENGFIILTHAN